jgi:hypothetical protein
LPTNTHFAKLWHKNGIFLAKNISSINELNGSIITPAELHRGKKDG